jgi:hypothetical protein
MPAQNPIYRNKRKHYYQEVGPDMVSVGSIINVLKTKPNKKSFDSQFIPSQTPLNGATYYSTQTGNAQPENNPDYQYYGYLYCDGSEYNISDYPLLYSIIGNDYGGTPRTDVTRDNVFQFWPDPTMGTFKVPDLLAKKLVGYGPVYGSGTPTIGNVEMAVRATGGSWYFSKDTQRGYFDLGNIRTTGYTDVVGTIPGSIIGQQEVKVLLGDSDLDGVPQHNHYLLHSEAPGIQGFPSGGNEDPYLSSYRNRNGRLAGFSPPNGLKLTHSHALSKRRIPGNNVSSYDIYNWQGGDTGPGSIKTNGNYYGSGPSGRFIDVTDTAQPLSKTFVESSVIGGRTVTIGGTPIYETFNYIYANPGTQTFSIPAGVTALEIEAYGAGGSGGVWTTAGGNGGDTVVTLGNSSNLVVTAGGGRGGGAVPENVVPGSGPYLESGGAGGNGGALTYSGTYASAITVINSRQTTEIVGGQGASGKFWNAVYTGPPTAPFTQTNTPWEGQPGSSGLYGSGSLGRFLAVAAQLDREVATVAYPNTGSFQLASADAAKYKVISAYIDMYGAAGVNCDNYGGSYTTGVGQYSTNAGGCVTGRGNPGKFFRLSVRPDGNNVIGGSFTAYPGQGGRNSRGTAASTYDATGSGGPGGAGYLQNGGGGGASTILFTATGQLVAGAGGGGGGGGAGEGACGDDATGNAINDGVQGVNESLFTGAGGAGGNYGCTGGGGGGGGGGVGTSAQTGNAQGGGDGAGSAGGPGGGGGGAGGHGGGYGGARGLSSYRTNYFDLVSSGNSIYSDGRVVGIVRENRGFWSSAAGGGGAGAYTRFEIPSSVLTASAASSVTITVGTGAAGVTSSLNRFVTGGGSTWNEVANATTSDQASNGYVKLVTKKLLGESGGNSDLTVGDVVIKASSGIEIYSSGTGIGTAGGFKLPTTQAPVVQILAQGQQTGSGATASCTVSGSVITGVALGNGGSGYVSAPTVRFLGGAGAGTRATTVINTSGVVTGISLVAGSSTAYTRYVKFGGPELERFIVVSGVDTTTVKEFGVKCARGNNINGGERPDDSGDELLLYYNTDSTLNFPESNFIGILVPRPSDTDIANNYDGTGSGNTATLWYTYTLNLPEDARAPGTRFKIVQKRITPNVSNDNGGNNDHYGICEFLYYYDFTSEQRFISTPGEISSENRELVYIIEGSQNSPYTAGIEVNDMTFTLTAGTPLNPTPALDPVRSIPLLEPYALTKYLIKAF